MFILSQCLLNVIIWKISWGLKTLSERDITSFLQALGLSKREIQIYMFLAKSGVQSTSFAAKRLKMERVQAYRTFKKLQEKGFIEATLERPTRFGIVPFEKLLESHIESRKRELENLSEQKTNLLSSWRETSAREAEYTVAKFSIITGKKKIHLRLLGMIEEAKTGVMILTTGYGLIQEDLAGVLDAIERPKSKHNLQVRIITEITPENLNIVENLEKRSGSKRIDVESRHLNLTSSLFPRFLIKDEEEAILYAISGDKPSALKLEDEGLWINDRMFISILKGFFAQMWQTAAKAVQRIEELKTGIPIGETMVIKEPEDAMAKVLSVIESAKEELIAITSSQGINNLAQNDVFAKYCKDLKCQIMAPLDLDNLDAAKKLAITYSVKHVPINFLTMMMVDKKHLFMFRSPPPNELASEAAFYMGDTFYTNDYRSIEKVSEMLYDAWKRGMEISQVTSQPEMRLPNISVSTSETMAKLVEAMLKNNISSILVTDENAKPVGVISDREVLKEIVEQRRDPSKTWIKDVNYTPLLTLDDGESITEALRKMHEKTSKRVAVLRNGQLMGILTQESRPGKEKAF